MYIKVVFEFPVIPKTTLSTSIKVKILPLSPHSKLQRENKNNKCSAEKKVSSGGMNGPNGNLPLDRNRHRYACRCS